MKRVRLVGVGKMRNTTDGLEQSQYTKQDNHLYRTSTYDEQAALAGIGVHGSPARHGAASCFHKAGQGSGSRRPGDGYRVRFMLMD
eukprot:362772-Chlamydomonas_euryale.AAC.5